MCPSKCSRGCPSSSSSSRSAPQGLTFFTACPSISWYARRSCILRINPRKQDRLSLIILSKVLEQSGTTPHFVHMYIYIYIMLLFFLAFSSFQVLTVCCFPGVWGVNKIAQILLFYIPLILLMWQGTPHIMIRLSMSYLLVWCTSVCTCILVHFWHYVMLVNSRILCLCCLVYMSYTRGTKDLFINVLFSHIMFMLPGIYVLYPWY